MKKTIFGLLFITSVMASCSEESKGSENSVDTEAVMELEKSTDEVSEGTKQMEEKVEELSNDVDELLNDI